jgi:hypothetical protein
MKKVYMIGGSMNGRTKNVDWPDCGSYISIQNQQIRELRMDSPEPPSEKKTSPKELLDKEYGSAEPEKVEEESPNTWEGKLKKELDQGVDSWGMIEKKYKNSK